MLPAEVLLYEELARNTDLERIGSGHDAKGI